LPPEYCYLSDVADITVGYPFESEQFNTDGIGVKLVRGMNVTTGSFRWGEDSRWWSYLTEDLEPFYLKADDIIVGMDGSRVGRNYAKVLESDLPLLLVQRVACIRAKSGIDQNYLWSCISSTAFEEYIDLVKTGTTIPHISSKQIGEYPVPKLDLKKQQAVGKFSRLLDNKIYHNEKINDNLLAIANQLYDQYFPYVVGDELPNGWKEGKLGDIIEIHDSKRIPLSGKERSERAKIYPYYGAASITDYVDDYIFDGIYLLLGEDGTVVTDSGAPVIQYVFGKFWVNNHAHILTGKNGFSVETLYLLCQRLNIDAIITGAVQPKISQANLKGIEIVIPPEDIIKDFSEKVDSLFSIHRNNTLECERLKTIRNQLLPKLMSGEIDVSTLEIPN